jgi:hypothetical protein
MQKSDFEQKFQKNMSKYLAGQQRDLLDYLWSLDRQDDLGELFGVLVRFPENLFGLFPGMGAYSLLARRLGAAMAEEMILSARTYTADEMKDAGLVHIVAEPGGSTLPATTSARASGGTPAAARCSKPAGRWRRSRSPSATASSITGRTPASNCASAI